jgi:elongation factor G
MTHDIPSPPHLVEVAIEPKSRADRETLDAALARLVAEDPSFAVSTDRESGQTILKGMSESQIEAKVDILKTTYAIEANVGAPQVAFLERPTRRAEVEYTYKKVHGPKGSFAVVKIVVEPNVPGKGYEFISKIEGNQALAEYIPGIEKGLQSVLGSGVVAGCPVVDVKVQLIDAKYHDVDSSLMAFEIAARAAFCEALQKAKSVLLEPIMKVDVVTPTEHTRAIIDDLGLRRGQIRNREQRGDAVIVESLVPLMNMFGYAMTLRQKSLGRATFAMQFDHYAPAPSPVTDPPFRPAMGMRA